MPPIGQREVTANGLTMPNGLGDEQDDIKNWRALDQMISGTHPTVQLHSNLNPGAAAAAPTLPAPALLESFDSTTGFTASGGATIALDTTNKVQGSGGLSLRGGGVLNNNSIATKSLAVPLPKDALGVVAFYVNKRLPRVTQNAAMRFGAGGTYSAMTNKVSEANIGLDSEPGGYWQAFHQSEISDIPVTIDAIQVRANHGASNFPYDGYLTYDALYFNAKGRPTWVIGFDDGEDTTHDIALPIMQAAGFKGTVYIPTAQIGVSDSMTWDEVRVLRDAGWAICLDGSPDDAEMTLAASVQAAVDNCKSQWVKLIQEGCASSAMYHICYPNGTAHVSPTPVQIAAMTGNGTTAVTFGAAAAVTNGMEIYGAGVPEGTVVVSGGGASVTGVTLNNVIPTQTKPAIAQDTSGTFYMGKLPAALKAAGFKSARRTIGAPVFSRFGFAGREMYHAGQGVSSMTLNQALALLAQDVLRGQTREFYFHKIQEDPVGWTPDTQNVSINMYRSFFAGLVAAMKAYTDAGVADVLTKSQWYERDIKATLP